MALALVLPLYLFAGLGGGDVKLVAASGVVLGPVLILEAAFLAVMLSGAGAVLAVLVSRGRGVTLRRWFGGAPAGAGLSCGVEDPGRRRMPMAPAIVIASLTVMLPSAEFARLFADKNLLDLIRCTA